MKNEFLDQYETESGEKFLEQGYVIFPLSTPEKLDQIRNEIYQWAEQEIDEVKDLSQDQFFDKIHSILPAEKLNQFRVKLIHHLTHLAHLKPLIYSLGKQAIHSIVGNELAMQRGINLSIQYPEDTSSVLPLHSDVWSGNSPYEVVFWLPLVDCYKTKSMYVLPIKESYQIFEEFPRYAQLDAEELFREIEPKVEWVNVPRGHGIIFTHSILHGNRVNLEEDTRWSFNVRFKSLFSPYGTKELGETFIPITIKPITRVGFNYQIPKIKN